MFLDNDRLLISETSPFPGSHGDSCVNTARDEILGGGKSYHRLLHFFTSHGQLRHPKLDGYIDSKGESWGIDDFSIDQWVALFIACALYYPFLSGLMWDRLKRNWFRTGDGMLINPLVFASVCRARSFYWLGWDLAILGQALLFKLPYRVKDDFKGIEKMSDSSTDYLNWFMSVLFALRTNTMTWPIRLALKIVSGNEMLEKAKYHFRNEPNSEWIVQSYQNEIVKVWPVKKN